METIVFKCGGSILASLPDECYQILTTLHREGICQPIIVHGGGPIITALAEGLGVQTQFVNGLRVTTAEHLDVVEMGLSAKTNKQIVQKLWQEGGKAWGISGVDAQLLTSEQIDPQLGLVGKIVQVKTPIIESMLQQDYIPVISPVALSESLEKHNVNADEAAASIAKALQAKLCFLTDVDGVQTNDGIEHELNATVAQQLIDSEVIYGGMIPKVQSGLQALNHGVEQVCMLNGTQPESISAWLNGEQVGTVFVHKQKEGSVHATNS
ncbi:acetylglutamate kinase [Caldalkalibacillus salinus]|uniref:acetylglutamate kinase n=1 Tax=Caldalkalibacillus salinus TaxID=2803787 RepID=UPI00192303DC